ncbi:MAG TPA: NUDIX hydrolase [Rhabdochlamydiaceae bacterium]|nr:NUDIX hydrolase [Rhabdochlamydiaceae bacterium]
MSDFSIPLPEILSSEIVYHGYFNVRVDHLKLPHGPELHYSILLAGCDAAAVLAETPDGKLVVLNEYRHPTGEWLWSCPGGRIDHGESPIVAASRELLEETGFASDDLISMGSFYPLPAICDQKIHFVLAKNATFFQPPSYETFEIIQVKLKTREELLREIKSGAPVDGILCTALMLRDSL